MGDIIVFEVKNGTGYFIDSAGIVFKDGVLIRKVIQGDLKDLKIDTLDKKESTYVNF